MTFKFGFDYLGWILRQAKYPRMWMALREHERNDFSEMYGCTAQQLDELILDLRARKVGR
jgi:hypothetical protein